MKKLSIVLHILLCILISVSLILIALSSPEQNYNTTEYNYNDSIYNINKSIFNNSDLLMINQNLSLQTPRFEFTDNKESKIIIKAENFNYTNITISINTTYITNISIDENMMNIYIK